MPRLIFVFLIMSWTEWSLGATLGKVGAGGEVLFVRLTLAETKVFEVGAFVTIETESGSLSGMVLSKKGDRARIKLDAPSPNLVAPSELTLALADSSSEASGGTSSASVFPAKTAISLVKSPLSPWTTYLDTSGSSNSDGSGEDIFETFNSAVFHTRIQYLFLMGQFQIGPDLAYFSSTNTIANNTQVDGEPLEVDDVKVTYSFTEFGVLGKYLFLPYKSYQFNPFGFLGFSMGSVSRKIADKKPQVADIQSIKLGVGAQYFVTATLALEAAFEYRSDSVKFSETTYDDEDVETYESISHSIATTGLNYGMSVYF
jgi:hypothetical protein